MQKQTKYTTTNMYIKKLCYICRIKYYSNLRIQEILQFVATWMELKEVTLIKSMKKEQILICGKERNKSISQSLKETNTKTLSTEPLPDDTGVGWGKRIMRQW